jgi:Mlc titration factor MtfA (ptsG expression regulator)
MTVEIVAAQHRLDADEREQLAVLTARLHDRFRWDAARGVALTPLVTETIAAHAALLVLRSDPDQYHHVSSVLVHSGPIRVDGPHRTAGGLESDGTAVLDGQSAYHGPVVINWSALRNEVRHPARGLNVALHEFAHALDHADGVADGTPPLPGRAERARWRSLCEPEFHRMVAARRPDPAVRAYATTNPAEFFAVVTETFFLRPALLDRHKPALYALFRDVYGQDPLARHAAAGFESPARGLFSDRR